MRVALVGFGRMGHEVAAVLPERGHEPEVVPRDGPFPTGCPVGIDFTAAAAVDGNVARAMAAGARYVVGTTGWSDRLTEIRDLVERAGGGLVHAPNFSIGVNLFYRIVRQAAATLAPFPDYDPYVLERHHRKKADAPSGTAKALAGILTGAGGPRRRALSVLDGPLPEDTFHLAALRAGGVIGDHTVGFASEGDEILLEHRALSRRGFALGAVLAAEWIATRRGVHTFEAVLDDLGRG